MAFPVNARYGNRSMDADHTMPSTSAHNDERNSSRPQSELLIPEQDRRLRPRPYGEEEDSNDIRHAQSQPKDRHLQAHSSRSLTLEYEARIRSIRVQMTDQFNEVLERKQHEWLDVKARLERELAIAQDSFKRCQTDLWRLQPLPQVTDTEILTGFDELTHRVSSWIDEEIGIFERLDSGSKSTVLFCDGGDKVVGSYMRDFPAFGEYYLGQIIHKFLCSEVFDSETYLVGLPAAAVDVLEAVEKTMPNLNPPRDNGSIVFWRSEALTALSSMRGFDRSKVKANKRLTEHLLVELLTTFPVLARNPKASSHRLQRSIVRPAIDLAIKMHTSKTEYQVVLSAREIGDWSALTRENLPRASFFDVGTRRPIKATSRAIIAQKGRLGSIIMPIEPSLGRIGNDGTIKELRACTFLAALD